jgi:hypothetical protein
MLAEIGRGFSDNCVYSEQIYGRVQQLMNMASTPVLTNLSIAMEGVDQCELYPFPLRDLFVGAPLLVAGKFVASRGFPSKIALQGTLSDVSTDRHSTCVSCTIFASPCGLAQGTVIALDVLTTENQQVPVNKVFLKQRIDLLTSRAWLEVCRPRRVCCRPTQTSTHVPRASGVQGDRSPDRRSVCGRVYALRIHFDGRL